MSNRTEVESLLPVTTFLDSRCRNSVDTRKTYLSGLVSFNDFLSPKLTVETVLKLLVDGQLNVYELLDRFVSSQIKLRLSPRSIKLNLAVMKSYFGYHDIDIIPSRYKKKVTVPIVRKTKEQPIDAADIRGILLVCSNRRLKIYVLMLASGGMRAVEALAIRLKDIDFTVSPTKIHIREEYAKTRIARDIYISDEATQYLKSWIDWKYRNGRPKSGEDLIFGVGQSINPRTLYSEMGEQFTKLLGHVGLGERKENGVRHKITLHTLRRFVDSTITDITGSDYADWFLGHADNSYYSKKEYANREIYATKCMKYLTFLDYTMLEATGKSIEAQLSEKDVLMQQSITAIDKLMKQREEDSKRIQDLESLVAKVLPLGKEMDKINEKLNETKNVLQSAVDAH